MNKHPNYEIARVALMNPKGQFLVVQRAFDSKRGGGLFEFPGGKVDPIERVAANNRPELYLAQAACRECGEETGIVPDEIKSPFSTYADRNLVEGVGRYTASVAFAVLNSSRFIPILSSETAQAGWMELGTIKQQLYEGGIFCPYTEQILRVLGPVLPTAT